MSYGERLRGPRQTLEDALERIGVINKTAVFVLGNQKSGTSAIGNLLAKYGGLTATMDILPEIRRQLIPRVAQGEASFEEVVTTYRRSFSRDVVKHPNFVLVIDHLLERFPEGRFIFVVRDPRDNIRSILDRLDLPGDADELTRSLLDSVPLAWRRILGVTGESAQSHYVENLCNRWNFVVDGYLRNAHQLELIRYEDFVRDKTGQIGRLADLLGIRQRFEIDHIVDSQFQPAGSHRSDALADFFGPANLLKIEQRCGVRASAIGY
jgi:hypothetical protein